MNFQCQRGALLASILWAVSLAAFGQVSTGQVSNSTFAAPASASNMLPMPGDIGSRTLNAATGAAPKAVPKAVYEPADTNAIDNSPDAPRPAIGRVNDQQSNFQRFVQQATGRALPVYGQNLFSAPSGYSPISNAPVPNDYILGPGDEIRLQVWGAIDFEQRLVINRHGQVNLPKVGVINLTGVRAGDLESVLRSKIARVFTNFNLNATLGRLRSIQIYVVGQARQPGTYTVSSLSTLINALFEVGGPSSNGSMRNIQLKRDGRTVGKMDLYDFIAQGDRSGDVPLQPGDVIVIPPVGPRVAVLGAFNQPAIYELKGADSIGSLLALGGGVSVLTTTAKALLERIDQSATPARQVEDFALDPAGLKRPLRDGDILTLFEISPQFANAVTLRGNVAAPLRYPYTNGMRIRDLIPNREALITSDYYQRKNLLVLFDKPDATATESSVRNLLNEVNWDYAVIERLDRATLTTKLIPFNLARAVIDGDEQHNLALQPGDIVTVLSKNDLRVAQNRQTRMVRVEGEVSAPGFYQVETGETLPQLLARLGGITTGAYLYGTEFTRESVRRQQQKNLDTVIRKLELQMQSESNRLLAGVGADSDAQIKLALQLQQQQQQQQLARIKALKSNGRISLELSPNEEVSMDGLPALPLEDGDAIYIPSRTDFVSAVGEVHNENSIIHRPGRTVGDVLKIAGVRETADQDNAFVLRADGSVVSARNKTSLFLMSSFEDIELMPGDAVVVPAVQYGPTVWSKFMTGLKDWTQILYQMGLGSAAWKTLQ